jgi:transcriptional regulator with XRE-family HTH domain
MPFLADKYDRGALREWCRLRGVTPSALEKKLGLGHNVVTRFLRGDSTRAMHVDHFREIAKALRVPLEAILVVDDGYDEEGCWKLRRTTDPKEDQEAMDNYAAICEHAQQHWTIHKGLNSYLRHEEHFIEEERRQAIAYSPDQALGYVERARGHKILMKNAQGTRGTAAHWIVTRRSVFDENSKAEWIETTLGHLKDYAGHSGRLMIAMLPPEEFTKLEREVSRILHSEDWVAINLIDGHFAAVQPSFAQGMTCHHPPTVKHLMGSLLQAVRNSSYSDFPDLDSSPTRRKAENQRTKRFLEDLLRVVEKRRR